jgi:hypothetical protein
MTDIQNDGGNDYTLPDEPPPDAFEWTRQPRDPDQGGQPAEFVNDAGDGVPGVRRGDQPPPPDDELQTTVE